MARSRSLPVHLFKDPDVIELANADHRLILISLVLAADDEGRGFAHPTVLACESGLAYSSEEIEQALLDLEAHDLVQCYQNGRHRYYSLTAGLGGNSEKLHPFTLPGSPFIRGCDAGRGSFRAVVISMEAPCVLV